MRKECKNGDTEKYLVVLIKERWDGGGRWGRGGRLYGMKGRKEEKWIGGGDGSGGGRKENVGTGADG